MLNEEIWVYGNVGRGGMSYRIFQSIPTIYTEFPFILVGPSVNTFLKHLNGLIS